MSAASVQDFGVSRSADRFATAPSNKRRVIGERRHGWAEQVPFASSNLKQPEGIPPESVHDPVRLHFKLLSDRDVVVLRPLSEKILQRRTAIVRDWYKQQAVHFGDSATLCEHDFGRIFEEALRHSQSALVTGDIEGYANGITRLGEMLAEHGVSLDEVIVSLHLFKEIVGGLLSWEDTRLASAFDKLSHVQIILLVSAFCARESGPEGSCAPDRAAACLPTAERAPFHGLVGATAGMQQLYQRIQAAASTKANLLIVGESGTGKELIARAVHRCSARAERPFVALNCAALPKDLIESELFGYKRGAFSGATTEYPGLFKAADGGTLLLDEITEMSLETQSKLLRAIQEHAIRPVGATHEQPVNVRVIASTNRDPQAAVADGHLRQDLYYRMQAAVLAVPALRDRRDDIPLLVDHFIGIFNRSLGRNVAGIEQPALDVMRAHDWPGNVRELSNALEGAFTFGTGDLIGLQDLPPTLANARTKMPEPQFKSDHTSGSVATYAESERQLIEGALQNSRGNKTRAAEQLRISRKKLYAKIAKYELSTI